MEIKLVIDRIEEGIAVLLVRPGEKDEIHWPLNCLPDDAQEGDILNINLGVDHRRTERTKKRVGGLIEKLKRKSKEENGLD